MSETARRRHDPRHAWAVIGAAVAGVLAVVLRLMGVDGVEVIATLLFAVVFAVTLLWGQLAGYGAAAVATVAYAWMRRHALDDAGTTLYALVVAGRAASYLVLAKVSHIVGDKLPALPLPAVTAHAPPAGEAAPGAAELIPVPAHAAASMPQGLAPVADHSAEPPHGVWLEPQDASVGQDELFQQGWPEPDAQPDAWQEADANAWPEDWSQQGWSDEESDQEAWPEDWAETVPRHGSWSEQWAQQSWSQQSWAEPERASWSDQWSEAAPQQGSWSESEPQAWSEPEAEPEPWSDQVQQHASWSGQWLQRSWPEPDAQPDAWQEADANAWPEDWSQQSWSQQGWSDEESDQEAWPEDWAETVPRHGSWSDTPPPSQVWLGQPLGQPQPASPPAPVTEPSTGLQTAHYLRERLSDARETARARGSMFSVVMVQIPDTPFQALPELRRSTVLRELGHQFTEAGMVDHLVHLPDRGRHWFAVVLGDTDKSGAHAFERRLRMAIAGYLRNRGLRLEDVESASLTSPDDDDTMAAIWSSLLGEPVSRR